MEIVRLLNKGEKMDYMENLCYMEIYFEGVKKILWKGKVQGDSLVREAVES